MSDRRLEAEGERSRDLIEGVCAASIVMSFSLGRPFVEN